MKSPVFLGGVTNTSNVAFRQLREATPATPFWDVSYLTDVSALTPARYASQEELVGTPLEEVFWSPHCGSRPFFGKIFVNPFRDTLYELGGNADPFVEDLLAPSSTHVIAGHPQQVDEWNPCVPAADLVPWGTLGRKIRQCPLERNRPTGCPCHEIFARDALPSAGGTSEGVEFCPAGLHVGFPGFGPVLDALRSYLGKVQHDGVAVDFEDPHFPLCQRLSLFLLCEGLAARRLAWFARSGMPPTIARMFEAIAASLPADVITALGERSGPPSVPYDEEMVHFVHDCHLRARVVTEARRLGRDVNLPAITVPPQLRSALAPYPDYHGHGYFGPCIVGAVFRPVDHTRNLEGAELHNARRELASTRTRTPPPRSRNTFAPSVLEHRVALVGIVVNFLPTRTPVISLVRQNEHLWEMTSCLEADCRDPDRLCTASWTLPGDASCKVHSGSFAAPFLIYCIRMVATTQARREHGGNPNDLPEGTSGVIWTLAFPGESLADVRDRLHAAWLEPIGARATGSSKEGRRPFGFDPNEDLSKSFITFRRYVAECLRISTSPTVGCIPPANVIPWAVAVAKRFGFALDWNSLRVARVRQLEALAKSGRLPFDRALARPFVSTLRQHAGSCESGWLKGLTDEVATPEQLPIAIFHVSEFPQDEEERPADVTGLAPRSSPRPAVVLTRSEAAPRGRDPTVRDSCVAWHIPAVESSDPVWLSRCGMTGADLTAPPVRHVTGPRVDATFGTEFMNGLFRGFVPPDPMPPGHASVPVPGTFRAFCSEMTHQAPLPALPPSSGAGGLWDAFHVPSFTRPSLRRLPAEIWLGRANKWIVAAALEVEFICRLQPGISHVAIFQALVREAPHVAPAVLASWIEDFISGSGFPRVVQNAFLSDDVRYDHPSFAGTYLCFWSVGDLALSVARLLTSQSPPQCPGWLHGRIWEFDTHPLGSLVDGQCACCQGRCRVCATFHDARGVAGRPQFPHHPTRPARLARLHVEDPWPDLLPSREFADAVLPLGRRNLPSMPGFAPLPHYDVPRSAAGAEDEDRLPAPASTSSAVVVDSVRPEPVITPVIPVPAASTGPGSSPDLRADPAAPVAPAPALTAPARRAPSPPRRRTRVSGASSLGSEPDLDMVACDPPVAPLVGPVLPVTSADVGPTLVGDVAVAPPATAPVVAAVPLPPPAPPATSPAVPAAAAPIAPEQWLLFQQFQQFMAMQATMAPPPPPPP